MSLASKSAPPPLIFPHPLTADYNGLLALGGDLSFERMILAYRFGIFPWYSEDQPILWYAPRERFVIDVGDMHIPKSMRRYLNNPIFTVTLDRHFDYVIEQCQQIKRSGQSGTWITEDLKKAFNSLHQAGLAHSVEVWSENKIVGGLYGLGIGQIFSGESMFSYVSDASKFATIILDQVLTFLNYSTIDCQQYTRHLELLGGYAMSNLDYHRLIRENLFQDLSPQKWPQDLLNKKFQRTA